MRFDQRSGQLQAMRGSQSWSCMSPTGIGPRKISPTAKPRRATRCVTSPAQRPMKIAATSLALAQVVPRRPAVTAYPSTLISGEATSSAMQGVSGIPAVSSETMIGRTPQAHSGLTIATPTATRTAQLPKDGSRLRRRTWNL